VLGQKSWRSTDDRKDRTRKMWTYFEPLGRRKEHRGQKVRGSGIENHVTARKSYRRDKTRAEEAGKPILKKVGKERKRATEVINGQNSGNRLIRINQTKPAGGRPPDPS